MAAKYKQVADSLVRRIQAGEIGNGARLPGEVDLARAYDVSRSTVRQALSNLKQAGLIETWTGAGSFVSYDGATLDDRIGWSKALAQRGVDTLTRVLLLARVDDPDLAREFSLSDPSFLALDRVRSLASGEAISLERSRVPWRSGFSKVLRKGLIEGSLQRTLEAHAIHTAGGVETVSLVQLSAAEAELLGRKAGDAFLATQRTVHDGAGALVERVDSLLHPKHFKLRFNFGDPAR
ncbi:GntR family transcriptional regulator [Methylocapsa sp. S129]|uniref:GntR family transcriptional regulator n=1 Tax=Methylocapsa sp. S129 TaxID=1641869 RepID=UPI00131CE842|nr:GntR family transcriptional regulator [Methylocapsa sp. S129]